MYAGIVSRIEVSKHPDPEVHSIAVGRACGSTVIVGKDTNTGDLGIYFECDGVLGPEFCEHNNLVRKKCPDTGNNLGGFFDPNRRVRAQKFRGVLSDGFWIPIKSLAFTKVDLSKFSEGDQITEIKSILICQKYETPATTRAKDHEARTKLAKLAKFKVMFPKHFDTPQFRHSVGNFKEGDLITITEKIHGTSQRYAHLDVALTPPRWSWPWLKQLVGLAPKRRWDFLVGTRNVTKYSPDDIGFHGKEEFRFTAVENIKPLLHKNEILFFEVFGWSASDTTIMPSAQTSALKDKAFRKKYGESFVYSYGVPKGCAGIAIYRIANMTPSGDLIDLTWSAVKARCAELGVPYVPEVAPSFIYDGDAEKLAALVESLTSGESTMDPSHIREGVCIRAERYPIPLVAKNKAFDFKVLEGIAKDNSDYVDMEESA